VGAGADPERGKKPTLLVLASTYPRWRGDPEPGFVHELARRLGADFRVLALVPSATGALPREMLDEVEVHRYRYAPRRWEVLVHGGGILANLRRAPWLALLLPGFLIGQLVAGLRLMSRERIDLIHAHWLLPQGLVAALLGRYGRNRPPFLATAHGSDVHALRGALARALRRHVVRRAGAVSAVSSALARELEAESGAQPAVLPMGVDTAARFRPDPDGPPRTQGEILFVGRLLASKGPQRLVALLPRLLEREPGASLSLAGGGPARASLEAEVERLGLTAHVRFLGPVPHAELPALFRRAAVCAAPFDGREGLGLVVVEAAACGCPVVATDLPSLRELFPADEVTFVPPGDEAALERRLAEVLAQPARFEQQALRARTAVTRLDWARVAGDYAALLASCLGATRANTSR
jgi:glycosyltransferase involved in cell wall biosynthesis